MKIGELMNFKKISIVVITFFIFISLFLNISYFVYAEDNDIVRNKNILVIGSYSHQNNWEKTVLKGIKDVLGLFNNIKVDYLDSEAFTNKEYYSEINDLYNMKYSNDNIDHIITIDDEALDFVRSNLFNKNSFAYLKPVFFLGVNKAVNFTNEENNYISGVIDAQSGAASIDFIKESYKGVTDIFLVLDNSHYCDSFKSSISDKILKDNDNVKIHIISSNYIKDIEKELSLININKKSAFLLAGTFLKDDGGEVSGDETISLLKSKGKIPIYTTLYEYINKGALGGVINNGEKLGTIASTYLSKYLLKDSFEQQLVVFPPANVIDSFVVDYKIMRRLKINPFNLPKDTLYINKGKFQLLVPTYLMWIIYGLFIFIITALISSMIIAISNKRKAFITNLKLIEYQEREKIKTNFIIMLSHELRTPLNIIMNTAKVLKMRSETENLDKKYLLNRLDYIITNSYRLLKSINRSITIAKIESGDITTVFEMLNIIEVVEDVVTICAEFAKSYDIELIFDTEEEEIILAIDKGKIERIMLNLISNAIKSIENSGSIFITCKRDTNNVYITVEDNGIGMSEEVQKHIFEKFFQTDENILERKFEGSGLGLYITKHLIDLHEGSISVQSTPGVGTTFTITLPIKVVVDEEDVINKKITDNIRTMAKIEFSDIEKNKKKVLWRKEEIENLE